MSFWTGFILFAMALAGILRLLWLIVLEYRNAPRRARILSGRCADCGYDLRGTPLRCPECGAVPDPSERARVAALAAPAYDLFTDRARFVLKLSEAAATRAGDAEVLPQHILAALAAEGAGLGAQVLGNLGVDLPGVVERIAPGLTRNERGGPPKSVTWSAQLMGRIAMAEASFLHDHHVGTEHLVLALLADREVLGDSSPLPASVTHQAALAKLLQLRVKK